MSGDPAEIRKRIQAQRKSQDPFQAKALAIKICETLFRALPAPKIRGLKVAIYRALPEELDPTPLVHALTANGAAIHFPRVVDAKAGKMLFAETPPGALWVKGAYGLEEPAPMLATAATDSLELIIVPGVAFAETGARIGRGAGFYDRALLEQKKALKVALAFDFQVLPTLPQLPHDQAVDWVLTERRDVRNSKAATWLTQRTV